MHTIGYALSSLTFLAHIFHICLVLLGLFYVYSKYNLLWTARPAVDINTFIIWESGVKREGGTYHPHSPPYDLPCILSNRLSSTDLSMLLHKSHLAMWWKVLFMITSKSGGDAKSSQWSMKISITYITIWEFVPALLSEIKGDWLRFWFILHFCVFSLQVVFLEIS